MGYDRIDGTVANVPSLCKWGCRYCNTRELHGPYKVQARSTIQLMAKQQTTLAQIVLIMASL